MKDGGPAFPTPVAHSFGDGLLAIGGLSVRDYFAACALTGIQQHWVAIENYLKENGDEGHASDVRQFMAYAAFAQADAMLKAREQKPE